MLRNGVPASVRNDFWRGFAEGLPELAAQPVGRVRVGAAEDLGGSFSGVEIVTPANGDSPASGEPTRWILRASESGAWRVDLLATFGPVFSPNLALWFQSLDGGADRDLIAEAIAEAAPSFRLGVEEEPLGPLGSQAVDGVDALLSMVES
jgi:hypothetical protein